MAAQHVRMLDAQTITPNLVQPRDRWTDLGAFRVLEVQVRVIKPGTGDNAGAVLKLQHAPVAEDDAFSDTPVSVRVDSTAPSLPVNIQVTSFSRFLRWVAGGAVAGAPVAIMDVIGKE